MAFEKDIFKIIVYEFGRGVVVTLYLIAYNFYFFVYFCLWKCTLENDVGKQVHGSVYMLFQYCRIVDGVFFVCISVKVAAYAFQTIEYVPCASVPGAFERHMFTEVCKSLIAFLFVACPCCYLITAINYRRI